MLSPFYKADGTLKGCSVYTLICQDESGPMYIKIGVSIAPTNRFREIRTGCPVTTRTLAWVEVCSRERAVRLEQDLHGAVSQWHTTGEWFKLDESEFPAFKRICRGVLDSYHTPPKPALAWSHINTQELIATFVATQHASRTQFRRWSAAYRAFRRDQSAS